MKRRLFEYPQGFKGVDLVQSKNDEGTEYGAWLTNPGGPGSYAFLGYVHPEDWDEFQQAMDALMERFIVGCEEFDSRKE